LVDVGTGVVYAQPVGSGSEGWVAASWASADGSGIVAQTVIQTSADGATWSAIATIPEALVTGLAWGDGLWVAVTTPRSADSSQSSIYTSTDLHTWTAVASVPGQLTGVAFGNGQWIAVGTPSANYSANVAYDSAGLIYSSTDGRQWRPVATITDLLKRYGLRGFESVGFGDGKWLAVAAGSVTGYSLTAGMVTYRSADGVAWTAQDEGSAGTQADPHLSYGPNEWLLAASSGVPLPQGTPTDGVIAISPDSTHWQSVPATGLSQALVESVGFGAGRWLATTEESYLPNLSHALVGSRVVSSTDGATWTTIGRIAGPMGAIAYGETAPSAAPTPTSTPGAQPNCTADQLQAAITSAGLPGTITQIFCSGMWAAAAVHVSEGGGNGGAMLFQWVNGSWSVADRTTVCAQNVLPPVIVPPACQSD
jgi:hypothetical protein